MASLFTSSFLICSASIILILMSKSSTVHGGVDHQHELGLVPTRSTCKGSTAECMADGGDEFEMESEISRRILATNNYISYGAMQRNNVPCSRRGASYYNCRPGAQANPYSRGCSAITKCRR